MPRKHERRCTSNKGKDFLEDKTRKFIQYLHCYRIKRQLICNNTIICCSSRFLGKQGILLSSAKVASCNHATQQEQSK